MVLSLSLYENNQANKSLMEFFFFLNLHYIPAITEWASA